LTVNSGNIYGSGGVYSGLLDGMQMGPGDSYFIPKLACPALSGQYNLFATADSFASGLGRLYIEVF